MLRDLTPGQKLGPDFFGGVWSDYMGINEITHNDQVFINYIHSVFLPKCSYSSMPDVSTVP